MNRHERGFTLLEMIIAAGMMVLLGSAASIASIQICKQSEIQNNYTTVVRQVQNADSRIGQDAGMAQSVTTANLTPPDFLVLSWTEQGSGDQYQVTYTFENMPEGQFKNLLRNRTINGASNNSTLVAQYIDSNPGKTACEYADGILTLNITATMSKGSLTQSETRIYKYLPRPD